MTFLVLFKWFKWNRFCQPLNFRFCAYRKWKWAYLELEMLLFARLSYGLALFAPFPDDPMQMWTVQKVWIAYLKDCRSRTKISSVECKPILTKLDEYRKMLLPISTRNGWISTRGENHGESKGPNLLDATRCHPLHPHPVARDILARWSQCLGLSQSGLATARAKALRERWDVVAFTFWAE